MARTPRAARRPKLDTADTAQAAPPADDVVSRLDRLLSGFERKLNPPQPDVGPGESPGTRVGRRGFLTGAAAAAALAALPASASAQPRPVEEAEPGAPLTRDAFGQDETAEYRILRLERVLFSVTQRLDTHKDHRTGFDWS